MSRSLHRRTNAAADEVVGDVVDILAAMGDFNEFKGMMVAHREGRGNGLVVTSSPVAAAGGSAEGVSDPRNQQPKRR